MTPPGSRLLCLVLLSALAIGLAPRVGATAPQPPAGATPAPLRLRVGTFDLAHGTRPDIPADLCIDAYPDGERGYYIVQFAGLIQEDWKDEVSALGADILDYIPDFAFKVRMTPQQAREVTALATVAGVDIFQPAFKLSPELSRSGAGLYVVRVERGADFGQTRAAIASASVEVVSQTGEEAENTASSQNGGTLVVAADAAQLAAIANVLDVAWIEPYLMREKHSKAYNEYGAGDIMGAATANARGYDGSTQVVAVADTGLGGGTATTAHTDIPASRIAAIYNWPGSTVSCFQTIYNDGAIDVDSGHGTHVAASVLGDGDANGLGKGTAPAANLIFQATENYVVISNICKLLYGYQDDYYMTGLPGDVGTLFQEAYDAGARVHSNSWGSSAAGDYTIESAYADTFIWNHKDMLVSFSAGNNGIDSNGDGVIDDDSMDAPATAKNVLTVGASENDRQGNWECDPDLSYTACASQGGQNTIASYGASWPSRYPANPINDDPTAGNAQQMAAFSSRGPTDDGRIKPDVVAPGTWILSGYSDLYQQGYDDSTNPRNNAFQNDGWGFPFSQSYKYMGGTSMSNPLAAGGAAVVRDFYQKAYLISASAALVKATLINSAVDLLDEDNDGVNDNRHPIPNSHEGWGRIDLADATDGTAQFADNTTGLATGASQTYTYPSCGTSPLRVTLVWTDYPSSEAASANLVNDLDLTVTSPSGMVYLGNVFAGGWSVTGGLADRRNNVENVYLQAPAAGVYTVTVSGYNVPSGSNGEQGYGLVVDGACGFDMSASPAAQDICAPADAVYAVDIGQFGTFGDAVTLSVSGHPAGATATFGTNPAAPAGSSTLTIGNTAAAAAGAYTVTITGAAAALANQDTVSLNLYTGAPAAPAPAEPEPGALGRPLTPTFTWSAEANTTYEIQVATDPAFTDIVAAAAGLDSPAFTPGAGLRGDTVYYWRVRGANPCGPGNYSTTAAFRSCGAYTSTDVPKTVPDRDTATSILPMPDSLTISDVDVTIGQISHAWVADLDIYIVHPDGATVELSTDNGSSGDNYVNTIFDDEAATAITAGSAPFTGRFRPESVLSALDGKASGGMWILRVSDDNKDDGGTLVSWGMTICSSGGADAPDYSDLPGSYGVTWHAGRGALRLGSGWTGDASFRPGDDNGSDDGISFPGVFEAGQPATVRVNTQGASTSGRWLRLWFDWDGDGVFAAAELAYDGAVAAGDTDLAVNVPASVAASVAYRARLYDSVSAPDGAPPALRFRAESAASPEDRGARGASTPAAGSTSYGEASSGEVEDGFAPCAAPGSVRDVTIGRLSESQVQLTWAAAAGANHYEVWHAANEPYFAPGADCSAPGAYGCETALGTSYEHAGLGNLARNNTYVVRAVSACGAVSGPSTPRVGEFEFEVIPVTEWE